MKLHDSPFVFVGNNIAVDFVNTEIVNCGQLVDLLQERGNLVQWAREVNLAIDSKLSQTDLTTALDLRLALKEVFAARIDNQSVPHQALDRINRHLVNYTTRQVLQFKENAYVLKQASGTLTLPMLLESLAHEGATLLASSQAERLKRCSNPGCVLIFVDTSRSHKRRWCSMETCGNRAKVSKHYRKQQS